MPVDLERVFDVLRAFEREGVRYVLVGGVALTIHGLVRATQDIDFFLDPDAANVERTKKALKSVFSDPEIDSISAADLAGDYPTIRYAPPNDAFVIDLISRLGTAFRFEDIESEVRVIEGIRVQVATPAMLFRMKRNTVRPIDHADAEALRRRFGLGDA